MGSEIKGRSERGNTKQSLRGYGPREVLGKKTGWQCFLSERQQILENMGWGKQKDWVLVIDQALWCQLIYSSPSLQGIPYLPSTEEDSLREVKQLAHTQVIPGSQSCKPSPHSLSITRPSGALSVRAELWERTLALEQPPDIRTHSSPEMQFRKKWLI